MSLADEFHNAALALISLGCQIGPEQAADLELVLLNNIVTDIRTWDLLKMWSRFGEVAVLGKEPPTGEKRNLALVAALDSRQMQIRGPPPWPP